MNLVTGSVFGSVKDSFSDAKKQFVKEPEKEQSTEEQILATAEVAQKKAEAWSDQTTRQLNYSTGQLTRGASQSMEAVKNNLSWKKTRFIRSLSQTMNEISASVSESLSEVLSDIEGSFDETIKSIDKSVEETVIRTKNYFAVYSLATMPPSVWRRLLPFVTKDLTELMQLRTLSRAIMLHIQCCTVSIAVSSHGPSPLSLVRLFPALESFSFTDPATSQTGHEVVLPLAIEISTTMPSILRQLSLERVPLVRQFPESLTRFKELCRLELTLCALKDDFLPLFPSLGLRSLAVTAESLTSTGIGLLSEVISKLVHLIDLSIGKLNISAKKPLTALCQAFSCCKLRTLNIDFSWISGYCEVSNSSRTSILSCLSQLPNLCRFTYTNEIFPEKEEYIETLFKKFPSLSRLTLCLFQPSKGVIGKILRRLQSSKIRKAVVGAALGFRAQCAGSDLSNLLSKNSTLRSLSLPDVELGSLALGLAKNECLEVLSVASFFMVDQKESTLVSAGTQMAINTSLRSLDMGIDGSLDGGLVLGSYLLSAPHAPLLEMLRVPVLSQAAVDLFRALNRNGTLRKVELINAATNTDYSNFFVALATNLSLTHLTISNFITTKQPQTLCNLWSMNSTLSFLTLCLSDEAVAALLDGLVANSSVVSLNLKGSHFGPLSSAAVQKFLKYNRRVYCLNLGSNYKKIDLNFMGIVLLEASANPSIHSLHLSHLDCDPHTALASLYAYLRLKGEQSYEWDPTTQSASGPRMLFVDRTPLGQCLDSLPLLAQFGINGVSTQLLRDLLEILKSSSVRIIK